MTVPIGTKLNLKAGGLDQNALEAMGVGTQTTSGTTPNQIKDFDPHAGGAGLGYFGVIGTTAGQNGALVAVGHEKVQLKNSIVVNADGEANKFNINEADAYSYVPPNRSKLFKFRTFETASDFTPPADGAAFAAFFNALA